MNQEAQRIAMALLDGWIDQGWYCAKCKAHVDGMRVTYQQNHESCGYPVTLDEMPDYLSDLNAVASVVEKMNGDECAYYRDRLISNYSNQRKAIDATAAQRCEAILKATGKWEDGQ